MSKSVNQSKQKKRETVKLCNREENKHYSLNWCFSVNDMQNKTLNSTKDHRVITGEIYMVLGTYKVGRQKTKKLLPNPKIQQRCHDN